MEMHQLVNFCCITEEFVASIYGRFMQLFPQEKDFWEALYKDEKKHTSFLIEADDSGRFNEMQVADLGFSEPLLDRTKTFLTNIGDQINHSPVSLEDALKMALKIEETMVEAFTNELLANLSPADNRGLRYLLHLQLNKK